MPDCLRARMRVGGNQDCSQAAWDRNEVGSWYGAWHHHDWATASAVNPNNLWAFLSQVEGHDDLGWDNWLPSLASIKRFIEAPDGDWMVVYLPESKQIGMGQLAGPLQSNANHPLNQRGEVFKYRPIIHKKVFDLHSLPDVYKILPTQGRQGNFHKFNAMRNHVELLARSANSDEVNHSLNQLSLPDFIEFIGPTAWESFSLSYLIIEQNFVPTGLSIGGTLPIADIVGKNFLSGTKVIAQCKKSNHPLDIDPDFINLHEEGDETLYYYFCYGGSNGLIPLHINLVSKQEILQWTQTENGQRYSEIFRNV